MFLFCTFILSMKQTVKLPLILLPMASFFLTIRRKSFFDHYLLGKGFFIHPTVINIEL